MSTQLPDVSSDPSLQNPPPQGGERPPLLRRLAAAGLLAAVSMTGAGCTIGGDQEAAEVSSTESTAPSSKDVVVEDIRNIVKIRDKLETATSEDELEEISGLYEDLSPSGKATFDSVDAAVDRAEAEKILESVEYDTEDPESARKTVDKIIDDKKLAGKAQKAIDAIEANGLVDEVSYGGTEPDTARKTVKNHIKDDSIRKQALTAIDRIEAKDIYDTASYGGLEPEQARQQISKIQDSDARSKAMEALQAEIAADDVIPGDDNFSEVYERAHQTESELSALEDTAQAAVEETADEASDWKDSIEDEIDKLISDTEGQTRQYVKRANNLSPEKQVNLAIESYDKPNQQIKLGDIKGEKIEVFVPDDNRDWNEEKVERFAEVKVVDGKVVLQYSEHTKIPDAAKKQFQQVVDAVSPLLHASFANGDLINIHFIIGDDYNPYYLPKTHEIYMNLGRDEYLSIDQLRSGLVHENTHALTSGVFELAPGASESEKRLIGEVCTSVRSAAIDTLQYSVSDMPSALSELEKLAKPEHKKLFSSLRKAVEAGNMPDAVGSLWEGEYAGVALNDCWNAASFDSMLTDASGKIGSYISSTDLEYLADSDVYKKLASDWERTASSFAIYSKFNEANYITSDYEYKEYLGHSEDNLSELIASIMDVSISYPDQFADTIKDMDDDEQTSAIEALGLSIDLLVKRHPELLGPMSKLEARILTRIHSK